MKTLIAILADLKKRPHFSIIFSLIALLFCSIMLGGASTYDIQGMVLVFTKLTIWVIAVGYYQKLMSAMGDNDMEDDWKRMNEGNLGISIYRTAQLVVVGIASAVLINKI